MKDLVVIGAGPGGYPAALKAAKLGLNVALIEHDLIGGTCLNRGCIPTKALLHVSGLFSQISVTPGIVCSGAHVDFNALRTHITDVSARIRKPLLLSLEKSDVELIFGTARITSPGTVLVQRPASEGGGSKTLQTKNIIIATGTRPSYIPLEGSDLPGVYTSDTLLHDLPEVEHLVIIGGGVVGMEIACFYSQIGAKVSVIEMATHILPDMDTSLSRSLAAVISACGGTVLENATVSSITHDNGQATSLCVAFTRKGKSTCISADAVLLATGRTACVDELFDSCEMPDLERGRIVVDSHMRTSIPHIYAIGDVANAAPQLAHAASAEGTIAVCDIAQQPCNIDLKTVPSCLYSTPEIACVGLSETQAKKQGIEVFSAKHPMTGNGRSVAAGLGRGFIKILADKQGHIIGAQLFCGNASDIISEITMAITSRLTVHDALRAIRPHPTFEEGVGEALISLAEKLYL